MTADGWVASDATKYSLKDQRPNWVSLVSVAVAVEDITAFNSAYASIVDDKLDKFGIEIQHPIIKNEDLNRWGSDWQRKDMRREIVTELLAIEPIDNIQVVETSLHSRWVTVFRGDENKKDRIRSEKFVEKYLQPYYNLISIWEYLRKSDGRPRTYRNVMTDDFSGKTSSAWIQIGKMSDKLQVIPKGDQTYPLLSLADLLMELIKQEVDDWNEHQIYRYLKENTPADSAYVDSDGINESEQLKMISPHNAHNVNTHLHYPHPIIFVETGNLGSDVVSSLGFFDHAAKFARSKGGCVKFFNEKQDRDYITDRDYVICVDGNTNRHDHFTQLNDLREPKIMSRKEAKKTFTDELGAYEN
jgi:hypothetical protein